MQTASFNDLPLGFSFPPQRLTDLSVGQRYRLQAELHEIDLVRRPGGNGRKARLLATVTEGQDTPFCDGDLLIFETWESLGIHQCAQPYLDEVISFEFTYVPATATRGTVFHNLILEDVDAPPRYVPNSQLYRYLGNDHELTVAVGAAVVMLRSSEGLTEDEALERLRDAGRRALDGDYGTDSEETDPWAEDPDAPF